MASVCACYVRFGILQLLSSAGLGGLGTVKKALTGGDVKEGINLHKKLYEALLRTKIEYVAVSMCGSETVETIQVDDCNEKESQVTIDGQRVNNENFENLILSGSIETLPTSSNSDMGWLMDTYIVFWNW